MGLLIKLIFNKTDQHGPRINSAPTYNRHFCIYVQNWYVYKSVNLLRIWVSKRTVVIVFFIQNQPFSTKNCRRNPAASVQKTAMLCILHGHCPGSRGPVKFTDWTTLQRPPHIVRWWSSVQTLLLAWFPGVNFFCEMRKVSPLMLIGFIQDSPRKIVCCCYKIQAEPQIQPSSLWFINEGM